MAAIEYAAYINCEAPIDDFACGKCNSCYRIKGNNHEYINYIFPLPKGKITSKKDDISKSFTEKTLQHYEDRAKGGAGLLILETSAVKWPDGATSKHQPSLSSDLAIPGLTQLAERVHKHDAHMIVQACHHGRISGLDISRDVSVLVPSIPIPSFDTLGMAINTTDEELLKMATLTGGKLPNFKAASSKELEEIIDAFVDAALRIKKSNLDGIEIHAAHGYLISTFLS